MKIYRFVPVALLLCVFTFTNVASAYSAPSLAALTTQLQGLLLQLHALLDGSHELTASSTVTPVTPRTCQVNIYTRVNGVEASTTTTMTGEITDQFAIGLSIGTSTKMLPYSVQLQSRMWGKASTTGTAGYFTPTEYAAAKAGLAVFAGDARYKIVPVALNNVNSENSGTQFSSSTPYAEALITNSAINADIPAGKVTVRVNVMNCTPAVLPTPTQDTSKPNILFVLTDDLDMQTLTQLPKLKSLMADKGMTFESHYTSLSLCCPSRTATLCGQYAHNNGVFTNDADNADGTVGAYKAFQQFGDDKKTVAVWLQNAGYRTALMGKYLNGYSADAGVPYSIPTGWSEWAVPLDGNAYSQYNYTLNVNGTAEPHYLPYCKNQGAGQNCPIRTDLSTLADRQTEFMTNVLNKKAKDFLTRSAKDSAPFFLYLAPYTPHTPATPAPRFESLLSSSTWLAKHPFPLTPAFNEADITDKPLWLRNNAGLLTNNGIASLTNLYHKRVISMYAVEDMLSDLIDTLEKNGQLDNTYIVFTSDNGFHLGQHRLTAGKMTEFDTDIHIPLIIRGPKVAAGTNTTQLTANVDIAPTIAALANLPIPTSFDGRSFKETLLGGTSIARNALLLEHADPAASTSLARLLSSPDEPRDTDAQDAPISGGEYVGKYTGIRTPQYTYVHHAKNDEEELYDNVNDPYQLNNVASAAGETFMKVLRNWTADLAACKGGNCRTVEAQNRLDGVKGALDGKACFYGGQQINNNTSRVFYSAVNASPSCEAVKQVRTCQNGVLSGSSEYVYNSCLSLDRFTGINVNQKPESIDFALMNKAGATWMRANASMLPYLRVKETRFADWDKFKAAHAAGKKGMINLMWDFEGRGEAIPAKGSAREQELYTYLDTVFLPNLLPYADIIVSGNEPFVNTLSTDWKKDSTGTAPIAEFYKRMTTHLHDYMSSSTISTLSRKNHKLYMGAFTRLYDTTMQIGAASFAVKDMLQFASSTPYVDGIDIHTHVTTMAEITASFEFLKAQGINKPITDSEYTYVHSQADHVMESLDTSDTRPFAGMTFAQKYAAKGYSDGMTVLSYMIAASNTPVTKMEWDDFMRSRSWTVDHFLKKADTIFLQYPVNGVTFGLVQTDINPANPLPWYMGFLYSSATVKHLPSGEPQGNYQYLTDFQKINGVTGI